MDKITVLLEDYLPKDKIEEIVLNYDSYKSRTLTYLGIDSLEVMGIVLSIEKLFNKKIDFESFNIEKIETLEKLNDFINE